MVRIIYKKGFEGQNKIECIEGIEIDMLNGQYTLIYPKYTDLPLLKRGRMNDWKAKSMTEVEALKIENSIRATNELLALDSPAAEFVRKFKSDIGLSFNLPTLLTAVEIMDQKDDIDNLAISIKGADLLCNYTDDIWSCSKFSEYNCWTANSNCGFPTYNDFNDIMVCVPTITYRKILGSKPKTGTCSRLDVIKFLKENPIDRFAVLATLLEDDTISIAELVKQKEVSLKKVAGEKTEELANACGLIVRYKDKINTKTVNGDAQEFLDNCSYTGIAGYGKHK